MALFLSEFSRKKINTVVIFLKTLVEYTWMPEVFWQLVFMRQVSKVSPTLIIGSSEALE